MRDSSAHAIDSCSHLRNLPRFQWRKALALGVLSPALFAMFVVMAFVTTLVTVPALMAMGWPASEPRSQPEHSHGLRP